MKNVFETGDLQDYGVGSVILGRHKMKEFAAKVIDVRYVDGFLIATMKVIHGSNRGKTIALSEESIIAGKSREYTDIQLRLNVREKV